MSLTPVTIEAIKKVILKNTKLNAIFKVIGEKLNESKLFDDAKKIVVIQQIVENGKISNILFPKFKALNSSLPDDKQIDISTVKVFELMSNDEFETKKLGFGADVVDFNAKNGYLLNAQIRQLEKIVKG